MILYHLKVISFNQAKEFRERRVGQTLKKKNGHIWTKKIGKKRTRAVHLAIIWFLRNCFQGAIKSNLLCKKGTWGKWATHFPHQLRCGECVLSRKKACIPTRPTGSIHWATEIRKINLCESPQKPTQKAEVTWNARLFWFRNNLKWGQKPPPRRLLRLGARGCDPGVPTADAPS